MNFKLPVQFAVAMLPLLFIQPANGQPRQIIRGAQPQLNAGPQTNVNEKLEQLYNQREYQKTIEEATRILQTDPRNHGALYFRGSSQVDLGTQTGNNKQVRAGIKDAREAVQLSQRKVANYYIPYLFGMTALSTLENKKEFAETAISIASSVLDNPKIDEKTKTNIYFQRGNTYLTLNQLDKAIKDFQSAVRFSPKHLASYASMAEAYTRKGDKQRALGTFDQIIILFPNNPLSYNNRGMFYQQIKEYDNAVKDFSKTIELNPKYIYAYTNRGYTYLEQGKPAEAERDFTESLKLNPRQPVIYNMRGSARLGLGKLREAISDHEESIKLDPQNPVSFANKGFTCFFAGLFDDAEGSFQSALAINPNQKFLLPWQYWTTVLTKTADTKGAKLIKPSLEQESGKRDWVDFLILRMAGKISDKELISAVTEVKGDAQKAQLCEAQFFLGMIYMNDDKIEEARKHFKAALETKAIHLSAYQGAVNALNHAESPLK